MSFLRTSFLFFLTCTIVAFGVLVPINYRENGTLEGVPPPSNSTGGGGGNKDLGADAFAVPSLTSFRPVNHGSTLYLTSHLVFAYVFTILALVFLHRNWRRYIPLRQLFSLELARSIPARTVLITDLPRHLRSERALADYFENLRLNEPGPGGQGGGGGGSTASGTPGGAAVGGLAVESVVVTRAIGSMREFLERRTRALRTLEAAWTDYLGNPVPVEGKHAVFGYERDHQVEQILSSSSPEVTEVFVDEERSLGLAGEAGGGGDARMNGGNRGSEARLIDVGGDEEDERFENEAEAESIMSARAFANSSSPKIISSRKRPTIRPHWFGKKVDALEYYAEQFRKADQAVRNRRKGKFRPTGTAFVTFQSLASAVREH